jgi:anti-anti-sigma factor
MSVSVEHQEAICVVHLDGEIAIPSAVELKSVLLQALASGKEICLDLEKATELDITALQLFWATKRRAIESGSRFIVDGDAPESILSGAVDAGFEAFPAGIR